MSRSLYTTADLEVRCHRCARLFEVVATEDDVSEGTYTVPASERASCPWCGYVHAEGLEFDLSDKMGV